MKKIAVDEKARQYWENYYKEYGRDWVRKIPRRIKAAMEEVGLRKSASPDDSSFSVIPLAHRRVGNLLTWEGTFTSDTGKHLFRADFSMDGNLQDFKALDLP